MISQDISVRLMEARDFDAVVAIDEKVMKSARPEYYRMKFEKLLNSQDCLPTSLVAVKPDGTVVGFIMGELFIGEYGIFQEQATLDTIGVDPDAQQQGVGDRLMREFLDHLKSLGVQKVNTLVAWNDDKMIHFFSSKGFSPSQTINLEKKL